MNKFNSTKYKNDYNKDHYDRINLTVPKGMKEKIKDHVDKYDLTSDGAYINMLIIQDMQKREEMEELERRAEAGEKKYKIEE